MHSHLGGFAAQCFGLWPHVLAAYAPISFGLCVLRRSDLATKGQCLLLAACAPLASFTTPRRSAPPRSEEDDDVSTG
eukprot:scaffold218456_cov19-Tisochrysis_lutea.AAC.1